MTVRCRTVGVSRGHAAQGPTPVHAYTLDAGARLAIEIWTYCATLIEVRLPDRHGRIANVVLRLPDLASYEDRRRNPYLGATLGRFARCVAEGRFRLDGREHQLERNIGRHHFHGGTIGFDRFVWCAATEEADDRIVLRLWLDRPDGDQGYPGAIRAEAVYEVSADGRLAIEFRATTSASTIVALTNHSFWNLAGTGAVDGHCMALRATHSLPTDEELIPSGPPRSILGTDLDFTSPRLIGTRRIDHCFVQHEPGWAADLHDPATGRALSLFTDQPGLALYSGDHLSTPRAGLCLQTGAWPDAPNHPDYPSARLDPGATYRHCASYHFSLR